jgi:hypothetical protein
VNAPVPHVEASHYSPRRRQARQRAGHPTRFRRFLAASVLAGASVALGGGTPLANPSFETSPAPSWDYPPEGWTSSIGASHGDGPGSSVADGPGSSIAVDVQFASEGLKSLRLAGGPSTRRWRMVEQDADVLPSERVTLRVDARCSGVKRENAQFANANAVLTFLTETGERCGMLASTALRGDQNTWKELVIDAISPPEAKRVRVGLFLSMTGTIWFDDVRLTRSPATADDAAGRARAFDALAGHLRRTYPFFGMAGRPSADALFGKFREDCVGAKDAVAFLDAVHAMLAELNDLHVNVETAQRRLPTARPDPRPRNMNLAAVQAALTERTAYEKNLLLAGRIGAGEDAIGYVAIGTFQIDEAGIAKVIAAIDALADCKALILDVRANGGGNEQRAAPIAGRFTKEPVVYARSAYRDQLAAATDAFEAPIDRVLQPVAPFDGRRVVVLQGPHCVSSTEGFLAMMRALPNVTTIGLPSRGASGNPGPFDLVPGVKVWASRWRSLLPDGACIEGAGIAPQIVVDAPHEKTDPTLERALAELRR